MRRQLDRARGRIHEGKMRREGKNTGVMSTNEPTVEGQRWTEKFKRGRENEVMR